jgi:hypothetical protein
MKGPMVLLRVADATHEGWGVMAFDEFLKKINLDAWGEGDSLIGVVLPQTARRGAESRAAVIRQETGRLH